MTRVQWRQRLAQASVNKSLNTPTIFGHNRSNTTAIFISLHRIQVEGVESGFLQRVVIVTQNRHLEKMASGGTPVSGADSNRPQRVRR